MLPAGFTLVVTCALTGSMASVWVSHPAWPVTCPATHAQNARLDLVMMVLVVQGVS